MLPARTLAPGAGAKDRGALVLFLALAVGLVPAPAAARAESGHATDGSNRARGLYAPEWISPIDPLARDLRALARLGVLPLRFATEQPLLRTDVSAALALFTKRSDAAAMHPLLRRAVRALAGEVESAGGRTSDREVRPWQEIEGERGVLRLRPYLDLSGTWSDGGERDWAEGARVGLSGTAHFDGKVSLHEDLSTSAMSPEGAASRTP